MSNDATPTTSAPSRDGELTLTPANDTLHSGGTVRYEVRLAGRWIGWVGDARAWKGSGYGARRWWACWRQDGDDAARWNSDPAYLTRRSAVNNLILTSTRAFLDDAYAEAKRQLAEAPTPEAHEAAAAKVRDHEKARAIVGLPIDTPEATR